MLMLCIVQYSQAECAQMKANGATVSCILKEQGGIDYIHAIDSASTKQQRARALTKSKDNDGLHYDSIGDLIEVYLNANRTKKQRLDKDEPHNSHVGIAALGILRSRTCTINPG